MPDLMANWPAPPNISALTTTRLMGASPVPYDGNNLALHVGDQDEFVQRNRNELAKRLSLPCQPAWLNQTHTNHCVIVEDDPERHADASITRSTTQPLAGWRGLLNGIISNTINKMHAPAETLMAWIGPAICQRCYETGTEVHDAYISHYPFTHDAFHHSASGVHADLPKLAELILNASGVNAVYQSEACTFELEKKFYSYRRQAQTGRMATLIWFNQG